MSYSGFVANRYITQKFPNRFPTFRIIQVVMLHKPRISLKVYIRCKSLSFPTSESLKIKGGVSE